MTVGPFTSTDTLFPSTAGDLELFTNEEVITLSNVGVLKSPITIRPLLNCHHLPPISSQIRPSGNKITEILLTTGIPSQQPLEVLKT